jgi:large subunit ribosomal protein L25
MTDFCSISSRVCKAECRGSKIYVSEVLQHPKAENCHDKSFTSRESRTWFTMSMSSRQYIKLAGSLPPRLTRFFARYPPQALLSQSTPPTSSTPSTSSSVPEPTASLAEQTSAGQDGLAVPSPFRAQKHPVTGKWHDPVFSLRRQAELVKLARQHGVEELLPYTVKGTEERLRRRAENGLRVKGTGVGQRVKGKESERTLKGRYVLRLLKSYGKLDMMLVCSQKVPLLTVLCRRLEKRRQAMLEMPQMIQTWKEVSQFNTFNSGFR